MKCSRCGIELPEGSEYCNICGAKIEVVGENRSFESMFNTHSIDSSIDFNSKVGQSSFPDMFNNSYDSYGVDFGSLSVNTSAFGSSIDSEDEEESNKEEVKADNYGAYTTKTSSITDTTRTQSDLYSTNSSMASTKASEYNVNTDTYTLNGDNYTPTGGAFSGSTGGYSNNYGGGYSPYETPKRIGGGNIAIAAVVVIGIAIVATAFVIFRNIMKSNTEIETFSHDVKVETTTKDMFNTTVNPKTPEEAIKLFFRYSRDTNTDGLMSLGFNKAYYEFVLKEENMTAEELYADVDHEFRTIKGYQDFNIKSETPISEEIKNKFVTHIEETIGYESGIEEIVNVEFTIKLTTGNAYWYDGKYKWTLYRVGERWYIMMY